MTTQRQIGDLVRDLVDARLFPGAVLSVDVRETVDHDDDPILVVRVVLSEHAAASPHDLSGLVRRLRPKLAEMHETRFPVLSFVADGDRTEAA